MGEVSSISKDAGQLVGHAKDPITSGSGVGGIPARQALGTTGAEALVLGAGGSAVAITWYMLQQRHGRNRPVPNRRDQSQRAATGGDPPLPPADRGRLPLEYHHTPTARGHGRDHGDTQARIAGDQRHRVWARMLPGSPLSDEAVWPDRGLAWDFNYRGDLLFLRAGPCTTAGEETCRSKTAGSTLSTAGRASSPKCFTSTFLPAGRSLMRCRESLPTRGDARRKDHVCHHTQDITDRTVRRPVRSRSGDHARSARAHCPPRLRHARLLCGRACAWSS